LQVTYLSSDSPDFFRWLAKDISTVFGAVTTRNGWLDNATITHFTTFLMVVVTVTVFIFTVKKVQNVLKRLSIYGDAGFSIFRDDKEVIKMLCVIGLLSINLILIGQFDGFSLLLALSVVATLRVLSGPKLQTFLGG
jgi:hypothetical protein